MNTEFGKICAKERKSVGLSQEKAAEQLGICTRSVGDYETGKTPVPDDIVANMVKIYNSQWIGYKWLSMSTEVGRSILPQIEVKALSECILDLHVMLKNISDVQYEIADIGRDNSIDTSEQSTYKKCINTINSLISAAVSVVVALKKKPSVLAHKRFME